MIGRYAFVDAIPDGLFDAVVANAHGKLRVRAESIIALRDTLLSGRLPAAHELGWPAPPLREPLLEALARSGIARHCEANPRITDEVLASLLGATDLAQKRCDELLAEWTLAARDHDTRVREVGLIPGTGCGEALIDAATWQRLRDDAVRIAARVALEALGTQCQIWRARDRDWTKIYELIEGLCASGDIDRARVPGLLQALDWKQSAELRALLADLPPLGSLIRALGRQHAAHSGELTNTERAGGAVKREVVVERQVREVGTVEVRELGTVEIRGVERSDELARMLASEAVLRVVPATKLLWHARRAERTLLAYHADATHVTHDVSELGFRDGYAVEHTRPERGPIIVVLDTSGSMAGRGEVMAKALVLQVLCVAELEQRACYVYNFSGPGDLVEHELALAGEGLAHALAFLTLSFGGATNIGEALRRAVARLQTETWANADVLIVTDGLLDDPREPFDRAILYQLDRARRRKPFRVHVALVPPSDAFREEDRWAARELADELHDLKSWLADFAPSN
jgi:hypothetical protein